MEKLSSTAPASSSGEDVDYVSSVLEPTLTTVSDEAAPACGIMSVPGRMRQMEDAITIRTNLCRPEINGRLPVHFFGVYDGHGGPHVAAFCRERMHVFMMEELMLISGGEQGVKAAEDEWQLAMKRCFKRMDEVALGTCSCGNIGYDCGRHPAQMGLTGSTAVVAVVTADHIIVANCGDSRAVLCRAGRAVPLSVDHKPDRADEFARIESLGGRVMFMNGARVEGILAMSRSIGDKHLKCFVISEPEISFTRRDPDQDECLILASDGLWDVVSSDLACNVASECLQGGINPPLPVANSDDPNAGPRTTDDHQSWSASAAALLTRLALGRESSDNISVIVVDLKST